MASSPESVPRPRALGDALAGADSLRSLQARMRASQACLEAVLPAIPANLRPWVQAGPWDAEGWTLLTAHAGALAKLRHLKPHLERALAQAGLSVPTVRLHALPSR